MKKWLYNILIKDKLLIVLQSKLISYRELGEQHLEIYKVAMKSTYKPNGDVGEYKFERDKKETCRVNYDLFLSYHHKSAELAELIKIVKNLYKD